MSTVIRVYNPVAAGSDAEKAMYEKFLKHAIRDEMNCCDLCYVDYEVSVRWEEYGISYVVISDDEDIEDEIAGCVMEDALDTAEVVFATWVVENNKKENAKMQLLHSLNAGPAQYVPVQIRRRGDTLHIQGAGPSVNRSYGVAVTVSTPCGLDAFLNDMKGVCCLKMVKSLAGTGRDYVPAQIRMMGGFVHMQINGQGVQGNREWGQSVNFESRELRRFIEEYAGC